MTEWNVKPANFAAHVLNPIRAITDSGRWKENPNKTVIRLSIGDPCVYGNFPYPKSLGAAIQEVMRAGTNAGYAPAHGYETARAAVALKFTNANAPLTAEDVTITHGCGGALHMAFSALLNPGDNILLPAPGFSAYQTICQSLGVECKFYKLDPSRNWEIDLDSAAAQINDRTRALLVNDPSNPCGSVYSREHLEAVLAFASSRRLLVISDEIYSEMAFGGARTYPLSSLTRDVPLLVVGGVSKRYLVPGWRLGWLIAVDRGGVLARSGVLPAIRSLSQVLVGANTIMQSVLPKLLHETPKEFYAETLARLESLATLAFKRLSAVRGLKPVMPRGAMYMMVGVDVKLLAFDNDVLFCEKLYEEESVQVLPGVVFQYPNFFRLVPCAPAEILGDACERIAAFCGRHVRAE